MTPSEWQSPPFVPVLRDVAGEQRIYARSAGDDKAAIYAQLVALDAIEAARIPLRANIRFVWEGEEEAGSPHLEQILNANRELVHGDVWLVCDGPVDQSRKQTLVFGARGDAHVEITVFGPNRGLHSGHYGNWAPNPAMMLVQLLAGMKDDEGHVLIPHFYDGITPLGALEKKALARAPVNDDALRQELSLGHVDGGGAHLLDLLNLPSLNINGISSGQTGPRANNVIPSTATADLDLRLVVGIDWQQQQDRVVDYVRSRGYFVVDAVPTREILLQHPKVAMVKKDSNGYNAVRTPMDLPIAEEVLTAVERRAARSLSGQQWEAAFLWEPWSERPQPAPSLFPSRTTTTISTAPTKTFDCRICGMGSNHGLAPLYALSETDLGMGKSEWGGSPDWRRASTPGSPSECVNHVGRRLAFSKAAAIPIAGPIQFER